MTLSPDQRREWDAHGWLHCRDVLSSDQVAELTLSERLVQEAEFVGDDRVDGHVLGDAKYAVVDVLALRRRRGNRGRPD